MRSVLMAGMIGILTISSGCMSGMAMSGAKAGVSVVKGAEARVIPIRDISPGAIKPYGTLALGEVTTDVGPICPPDCVAAVRMAMSKEFTEQDVKEHFPGSGKKLVADVVCRFFKEKKLFGKEPRLDLLVTLVDGESRQELGKFYVEGLSGSPLAGDAKHMAEEDAKELCRTLRHRKEGKMDD